MLTFVLFMLACITGPAVLQLRQRWLQVSKSDVRHLSFAFLTRVPLLFGSTSDDLINAAWENGLGLHMVR